MTNQIVLLQCVNGRRSKTAGNYRNTGLLCQRFYCKGVRVYYLCKQATRKGFACSVNTLSLEGRFRYCSRIKMIRCTGQWLSTRGYCSLSWWLLSVGAIVCALTLDETYRCMLCLIIYGRSIFEFMGSICSFTRKHVDHRHGLDAKCWLSFCPNAS